MCKDERCEIIRGRNLCGVKGNYYYPRSILSVIPNRNSLVLIVKTMLVSKEFNLISKPSFLFSLRSIANCTLWLQ